MSFSKPVSHIAKPQITHSITVQPRPHLTYAGILGIGIEGLAENARALVSETPNELLTNFDLRPDTELDSTDIRVAIQKNIEFFKMLPFDRVSMLSLEEFRFAWRLPDLFPMQREVILLTKENSLKYRKLAIQSDELLILCFQNPNYCIVPAKLEQIQSQMHIISQKHDWVQAQLVKTKKNPETFQNVQQVAKIFLDEMENVFQEILECRINAGIAKIKGKSTYNTHFIPISREEDSTGQIISRAEFQKATIGESLSDEDLQNCLELSQNFLQRACRDFFQNEYHPGTSFYFDPFFVNVDGIDSSDSDKEVHERQRLTEESKRNVLRIFQNNPQILQAFLKSATADFSIKLHESFCTDFLTSSGQNTNTTHETTPRETVRLTSSHGNGTHAIGDLTPPSSPSMRQQNAVLAQLTPGTQQGLDGLLALDQQFAGPPMRWGGYGPRRRVVALQNRQLALPAAGPGPAARGDLEQVNPAPRHAEN